MVREEQDGDDMQSGKDTDEYLGKFSLFKQMLFISDV